MKTYSATAVIDAPAHTIWEILTNAAGYPSWDPWAVKIEGTIAPGATITAYTKLSPRAFPVKITAFEPERLMVWEGGLPFGLFTGVRRFALEPQADGAVAFTVGEVFSGPLLPLFARSLPDMTKPFADFVAGLKERAEDS
jgi:hypothetical protein